MADERRRAAKTQSLSLRLDSKTKFILELVAPRCLPFLNPEAGSGLV